VKQQQAAQAAQAKQAQSDKDKARTKIKQQLSDKGWTIEGNQAAGVNKLAEGETIEVRTKKSKIKVKFEGGQVKQDFTT
jgi:hypothetical protein